MFGFFKSGVCLDEVLGAFTRHGRYWIGKINIPFHETLVLRLSGNKKAPNSTALELARALPDQYPFYKSEIEKALYEHFIPYAEAYTRDMLVDFVRPFPQVLNVEQIWSHVYATYILIEPMGGIMTVEIVYRVEWDEEHLIGARFQDSCFLELCGSV